VGYSLGARLALHLALVAPQVVGSLCLLGGDPGLPLEGIEARWHQDQRWASLLQSEGWDPFSKEWEALPLFQGLHRMPAESLSRWRAWRAQANPEPSLLAETLLAFSPARQASLWPELRRITAPTWWVAGAEDAKYAALVPRAAAAQGPQAQVQLVPGCTHALPIEAPAAVAAIVRHAQEGAKRRRQSPPLAAGGSA
jgi:pimeloyl-ACP methyl ester carboxylesterase